MKFTYTQPAGENTKFAPNAFDSQIGKEITLNTPSGVERAIVLSTVVSNDGSSAEITVETAADLGLAEEDLA